MAINEAGIDAIANRVLGFGSFDKSSTPTPDAVSALSGSRRHIRRLVKTAIRNAIEGN